MNFEIYVRGRTAMMMVVVVMMMVNICVLYCLLSVWVCASVCLCYYNRWMYKGYTCVDWYVRHVHSLTLIYALPTPIANSIRITLGKWEGYHTFTHAYFLWIRNQWMCCVYSIVVHILLKIRIKNWIFFKEFGQFRKLKKTQQGFCVCFYLFPLNENRNGERRKGKWNE